MVRTSNFKNPFCDSGFLAREQKFLEILANFLTIPWNENFDPIKGRDVIKQVFTEKEILLKLKSDFVIKLFGTFKTTDEIFFVLR